MIERIKFRNLFHTFLPFLIIVFCWEAGSFIVGLNRCPDILLTFTVLFQSLFHEPIVEAQGGGPNGLSTHIMASLCGFLGGFCGGVVFGFVIALLMLQSKPVSKLLEPALEFFRALPPLLVIPFAILLCHSNETLEFFTVAIYSAFSICVYTLSAFKNIAPNYAHLARLLGASKLRLVFDVQIPAIMPELVGALRVTSVLSLGIAIVVEYLAAPSGLGRVMKFAISYSRVDLIMVSVIWVILIALTVDVVITMLFASLLKWAKRDQIFLTNAFLNE